MVVVERFSCTEKEILPCKLYSHVAQEFSCEWSNGQGFIQRFKSAILNYHVNYISCNDFSSMISTIRRWMCTGECLQVYTGHTSFIYRSDTVISQLACPCSMNLSFEHQNFFREGKEVRLAFIVNTSCHIHVIKINRVTLSQSVKMDFVGVNKDFFCIFIVFHCCLSIALQPCLMTVAVLSLLEKTDHCEYGRVHNSTQTLLVIN